MPIKLLDSKTVALIAAGEVVERPASVVKELVENSLDAGSSEISVEVRGGGVSLIRVADDGAGIPTAEVELAFQRHATSKIVGIEDLKSISSLGFRGEALPSIAAVADVEIVTCARGETSGTRLVVQDGRVAGRGGQGRPQGTTVTVTNLFRRVPARLKFLKTLTTENSHIAGVVSQYALAYPEAAFSLTVDGRLSLKTPGCGELLDSVIAVYGADMARRMLRIEGREWQDGMPQVTGLAGSPETSRAERGYLSLFVNRRWVSSRILARAVEEAYKGLLTTGKHPVAIVNISIPPGELDVNIHPAKTEVKFRDERLVFIAVQRAVRRALLETAPVHRIEEIAARYSSPVARPSSPPVRSEPTLLELPVAAPAVTPARALPVLRVLAQLQETYILAEGPDGLYLIDQHAAHERVLFEKIAREKAEGGLETQGLLEPAAIEVSPRQEVVLGRHYEELAEFGFSIEPFGQRTYLVRTVPALLRDGDWMGTVRELLDSLSEGRSDFRETVAISMACHGAVRAGQALSDAEMRELVRRLEEADLPNTCPHGRPTLIHLSSAQLEREFKRT